MKLSERIRVADFEETWTEIELHKWADEVEQLEAENGRLRMYIDAIAYNPKLTPDEVHGLAQDALKEKP